MEPLTIGLLSVAGIFVFILLGFHVGVALAAASFVGVWAITGRESVAINLLVTTSYSAIADYAYSVIPMFVVMGLFATLAGATRALFDGAAAMLWRVRGGIGISTVIANAIFAAITGVSVASAAVFSKLAIPEMNRLGYNRRFALGIVASSALLGMLIPPSILMIVYGVLTEESIGKLFAAGVGPGLLVAFALALTIWVRATLDPTLVGGTSAVKPEAPPSIIGPLLRTWPFVILITIVLGGIYGGIFTPTEAGAVGAFGALALVLVMGKFSPREVWAILLDTGKTCAAIFFLLITAQMYSRMLTLSGLPAWVTDNAAHLAVPGVVIILIFVVILLILGCILDSISILLLTMPIMVPVAGHFGYDPIWFGMIAILTVELGLLTPPFGMVVFAMKASLPPDVTVEEIFAGGMSFFVVLLVCLGLVITFPQISLWLPSLIF